MLEELDQSFSLLEELNQFAHDLLWTWEPRIEAPRYCTVATTSRI